MSYQNISRKFFLLTIFNLCLISISWSQEFNEVAASYNDALKVVNDDPEAAQNQLEVILPQAEALGEEGAEIKGKIEELLPSLQYKTALADYKAKDMKKAISGFEKAIELATKYGDSKIIAKIKPKLPAVYYSQGTNELKAGNEQEADKMFDKALALNENYAKAYYGKSLVLRSGDEAKMFENLDKAIEVAGESSKSTKSFKKSIRIHLYKKAKAAVKAKKYQQAVDQSEKALTYDFKGSKDSDRIYVQLGKAYAGLNKKSKACETYKKVTGEKYKKLADYEIKYTLKCN